MRWRALVVGLIALAAIGAGLLWIFSDKATTSTDDAYVQADKTIVSPKVRGMVLQILAQENRPVKAGDLLVKIDPEEYDLQISKAQGDLMAAKASGAAARAGLSRLDAEEKLAEGVVNSAEKLAGPKGAADPIFRQAFETAHGQALVAARTRGEIVASMGEATAAEYRAKTELDAAQLQKSQTSVVAPAGGTIADVQATVGQMVQPGVTLMTIVGEARPTVTANFKETQIGRMRPGQPASVRIDALSGQTFTGHVDSLAPGSGSQFALLPFEPGAIDSTWPVKLRPGSASMWTVAA
jgi:membrane fusion protein (multidrug efflux system)